MSEPKEFQGKPRNEIVYMAQRAQRRALRAEARNAELEETLERPIVEGCVDGAPSQKPMVKITTQVASAAQFLIDQKAQYSSVILRVPDGFTFQSMAIGLPPCITFDLRFVTKEGIRFQRLTLGYRSTSGSHYEDRENAG